MSFDAVAAVLQLKLQGEQFQKSTFFLTFKVKTLFNKNLF